MFTLILLLASILGAAPAGVPPAEASFQLSVSGAGSRGTLGFDTEGVRYRAADPARSRQWPYHELKQIRVMSPRELAFDTFEDGSRWRFGADRSITFELSEGEIDGRLVAFLLQHVARPVASAVLPIGIGEPRARLAAKHLRGRKGTQGVLAMYASGLAFDAGDTVASKYWRYSDIESIQRTGPFRLLINVYERGSVRSFEFELKESLSAPAFDYVWDRVNRPADRTGGIR